MPSGSSRGKVRPSEIAADTKRNFIPLIRSNYSDIFPPYSILYSSPTTTLSLRRKTYSTSPPRFAIESGDPVSRAISCSMIDSQSSEASGGPARIRVPFICAANERRPGGDWETGCAGYEETLCRRSNLAATLATPHPQTGLASNYPIPTDGGVLSDSVAVYRGPHEKYEKLDHWYDLPVISVPPTRWPKLKDDGTKYSFAQERAMTRDKILGALRICLYNNYDRVVIGDFGLGNGHRNPPQEMAEIWRDVFLFDPDLRGQFAYVVFVFDDPYQSTAKLILDEATKKENKTRGGRSGRSGGGGGYSSSDSGSVVSSGHNFLTDMEIFQQVFDANEIERVLRQPDPRYGLDMIAT